MEKEKNAELKLLFQSIIMFYVIKKSAVSSEHWASRSLEETWWNIIRGKKATWNTQNNWWEDLAEKDVEWRTRWWQELERKSIWIEKDGGLGVKRNSLEGPCKHIKRV